jgi:hypothetical protein
VRFPFLDQQFVAYGRSLPRHHKVKGNQTKIRLRHELSRIKSFPRENIEAGRVAGSKGGFTPVLERWWRDGLGDWCDRRFPRKYFHLLDRTKLKLIQRINVADLNLWTRLRIATANEFLEMVEHGVFRC